MIRVNRLAGLAQTFLRRNSPALLTAVGVSGTVTTAYLAAKAAYKSAEIVSLEQKFRATDPFTTREKFELTWKLYVPAGVSGALTIASIISATKISNRRTAAITAAYSLSEKAFVEYKEKVIEHLGERKEQSIRDQIAQDRVTNNPPASREVILSGSGTVLCCELFTGRYFHSDMETLRKSQNDINAKLVREDQATLDDFYYLIKLPSTSYSGEMGWTSDRLMELRFSTVLTDDGRPCLAFEYNYTKPR